MNEVDISEQNLFERSRETLHALLKDHTRTAYEIERAKREGRKPAKDQWNIIWATGDYFEKYGEGFGERDEITEERITGENRYRVRPRAIKDKEVQRQRSKDMAEVFTPGWVCNAQNNLVDEAWFGRANVFNEEFVDKEGVHRWTPTKGRIRFDEKPSRKSTRSWQDYVKDVRLEITCGEAPYLVSRYDSVTGQPISDLDDRVGLLDRKLRVVSENTKTAKDWIDWAKRAVQSVYGFEWQGDNLLLAREAVLYTVFDYYRAKFARELEERCWKSFAYFISWNLWQMDGLKMVLPYSCEEAKTVVQDDMFGAASEAASKCPACDGGLMFGHKGVRCLIRDWAKPRDGQKIEFEKVFAEGRASRVPEKEGE